MKSFLKTVSGGLSGIKGKMTAMLLFLMAATQSFAQTGMGLADALTTEMTGAKTELIAAGVVILGICAVAWVIRKVRSMTGS